MVFKNLLERVGYYFNLMPDKEEERECIERISKEVSFKGANLWVLIFAIFLASLGLNVNSTAVIIGAMLISPLMGPIIGMGLAVGINDLDLLKRSAKNYAVATLISVLTATLFFLISPLSEAQSELLARTSPTLYDVLIAFCGGAAGIIAICTKGKGNVIPGVAIATALMPPLCTAGYGLANGHLLYFLGAFYLFFINTVFIALATFGGVRLMNFHQHEDLSAERARRERRWIMSLAILTMIPAAIMTILIARQSVFDNNVNHFIKTELQQRGTQIISHTVDKDSLKLRVVAVGREITEPRRMEAQSQMNNYGMEGFTLRIIQGTQSDSLLILENKVNTLTSTREAEQQKLLELSAENSRLMKQLAEYTSPEQLSAEIRPELATLFPQVQSFSLSRVVEFNRDSTDTSTYLSALIQTENGKPLAQAEKQKLHHWLQMRTKADSLVVVMK
jgi:uncharacterized hydrophobic protein (TIGR00271 family)